MFGEFDGRAFESMQRLRKLELDANRLTRFDAGNLDLHELDLSANHLAHIDLGGQLNLVELNLSSNKLTSVPDMRDLMSLRALRLDNNQIGQITSSSFAGCCCADTLLELDLSRNRIENIDADSFARLGNLVELNLSLNKLDYLPDSVFRPLKHVEKLSLAQNRIDEIDAAHLHGLVGLRELDLSRNKLNVIKPELLRGLRNMRVLSLSGNLLTKLDADDVFQDLGRLSELWLDNNQLSNVNPRVFESVPNVRLISIGEQHPSVEWSPYCSHPSVFEYVKLKMTVDGNSHKQQQQHESQTKCFYDLDQFISQFTYRGNNLQIDEYDSSSNSSSNVHHQQHPIEEFYFSQLDEPSITITIH